MDRQTLIRDMKSYVGGGAFITTTQVARYMRVSTDRMPGMLKNLEYLRTGRAKQYFIPDVAGKIIDLARSDGFIDPIPQYKRY